ncbi:Ribosomal small subunit pseudouridine synthase A [Streptococcus anginosus]|nr:Ribosomal small subunit pseudouridine synthase A [Streptococcus anginosus]
MKRMVQACGKKVTDLERLSMGPLTLDRKLEIGTFRRLTKEELEKLTIFGVEV